MGRAAAWAIASAAALCAIGASAEQPPRTAEVDRTLVPYANPKDAARLPDGRLLHIVCMGRGSPTVILTAGAGDWSLTWSKVQPEVAKTTRACAWDRPGFGFSSPPPEPQTVDQTTSDLQAALRTLGIAGPYVLVGHSLGGYESLLFADRELPRVAGMVLVDPSFPDQETSLSHAAPQQAQYMLSLRYPVADQIRKCSAELKAGTLRQSGPDPDKCLHPHWPPSYPPELSSALTKLTAEATPAQLQAAWDTLVFFTSPYLLAKDSKLVVNPRRDYGAMPLIVLTRTEFRPPLDFPVAARAEIPAEEAAWNAGHDAIAALSSRGVNARVPGTPHFIHAAKPQVVIDAIEQVVREARQGEGKRDAR